FYAVTAGVAGGLWLPVAALVIGSVVSLYYYLRIAVVMLAPPETGTGTAAAAPRWPSAAVLVLLTAALLGLGVYPRPLVAVVRSSATELAARRSVPAASLPALRTPAVPAPRR
ncbi:MAG TPA: hypothetical protein VIL43_12270, partial [Burkholderiales bacterium]